MKKILMGLGLLGCLVAGAEAASPSYVLGTLPYSNELSPSITCTTGSVSAVSVSSSVITRIDTAFNAAALSACGANYQRAEITTQNNGSVNMYCGYSASGLTVSNSFAVTPGAVWVWKLGKGMAVYCLNAAGSAGTLIVGGVAWR